MSFFQKQNKSINANKINKKHNDEESLPVFQESLMNRNMGGNYRGMTRIQPQQNDFFQQGNIMGKMNDVSASSEMIGDLKLENFLGSLNNKSSSAPHYDDFGKKK